MKQKYFYFYFLFSTLTFLSCSDANSQVKNMGINDFVKTYQSSQGAQLLDVRTPQEWAQGKIASSKLMSLNDPTFSTKINTLDKTKPVFVYCAVGGRSSSASQILAKAGFKVYNLQSAGYNQLAAAGIK